MIVMIFNGQFKKYTNLIGVSVTGAYNMLHHRLNRAAVLILGKWIADFDKLFLIQAFAFCGGAQ